MADVRAILTDLGCTDVATVLQSGNAVFSSTRDANELEIQIADALHGLMQKDIGVIVRDVRYFEQVVAANPFSAASPDGEYVGATFLAERPDPGVVEALGSQAAPPNAIALGDRVVYTYAPMPTSAAPDLTKLLNQVVTARNWRTTTRILRALET